MPWVAGAFAEPARIENGRMFPPAGPGLGLTIPEETIPAYRVRIAGVGDRRQKEMGIMAKVREHRSHRFNGDGIGNEVVPEGSGCWTSPGRRFGYKVAWTPFPWSCEHYHKTGERCMPEERPRDLKGFEAIFLGAVATPGSRTTSPCGGCSSPSRRGFQQYANVRPSGP
jgi:hypothetical protein